jgi:hypothetical protein
VAGRKSGSDCSAFDGSGTIGRPAGSGTSIEAEDGSSGLRRLNKTLYQTEREAFAYHGACLANNIPFMLPALNGLPSPLPPGSVRRGQSHVEDVDHGCHAYDRKQ